MEQERKAETKKKPGRPKKTAAVPPVDIKGIIQEPSDADNAVQLEYHNPILFHKLVRLFYAYGVNDVYLKFDHNGLRMMSKSSEGKLKIYHEIIGSAMLSYYCREPITLCVGQNSLTKVFGMLKRQHDRVTIIVRESFKSMLKVTIHDSEYNVDEMFDIDVTHNMSDDLHEFNDVDTHYPLSFQLQSADMKDKLNKVAKMSNILTVQKTGNSPLELTFDGPSTVSWTCIYNDPSKIALKCTMEEDGVFNVSVPIENVRPFTSSALGSEITIALHTSEKASLSTAVDLTPNGPAARVKVFVDIVRTTDL